MAILFAVLYEIGLWLLALIALPKLLYDLVVHKKHRKSFLYRLGCGLPKKSAKKSPVIWIHAISLGETKAAVALAREIKKRFPNGTLVISSVTETGHQEAQRCMPFADHHIYLPLDFNLLIKRAIKRLSPDLVLLCESDFWLNFLQNVQKNGGYVGLINGKISEKSAKRYSQFPFFSRRLFGLFDIFCMQNSLYQDRFIKLGIPQDKTLITGNLKFDDEYPQLTLEEVKEWRQKLGISPGQFVLTIGSTHDPEETLLIDVLTEVWKSWPNLKVLLIPRHPERYDEAGKILEKKRMLWTSFTDINRQNGNEQIILMNAMGLLRMCYQLSDFSIVGGSYTDRIGGHNIMEPCWYGKPVIFGPYMHTQVEFVNYVKKYESGFQVDLKALPATISRLLEDESERSRVGQKGMAMMDDLKGATHKTIIALSPVLQRLREKYSTK
ncbi:MAG: 3-deoxy-D-manno-octulosonic acid transferase [Chlamydiales bacterium]